ncbi:MAG: T9SS type A sorting domain-containing protein [Candidatus Marinimicrobia bacterium]|nr:T9SS type A sorting domain-containing protein [Candidatus Neomarinimicrobiota bacterium]
MKKTLILLMTMFVGLMAATTSGVVHFVYENGVVTTSGDDTFYEFDIQAYVTGTTNSDDLLFGSANVYVEYDTGLFGNTISGTSSLEFEKIGLLATEIAPGFAAYNVYDSQNTFPDVFALTFEAGFPDYPSYYQQISNDSENPSDLFHIKMKAIASGSGEVSFPYARINDAGAQFWTLANLQYTGPADFSESVEPVYIEGPVTGETYTSIELDYFEVASKGGKVRLRWRTQSETENLGFIVKRALVLGEYFGAFEEIDSYHTNDGLLGAGTTSKKTDYMYWDKEVRPGITYAYVLQDIDESGHIRECEPVIVHIKESKVISTDKYTFSSSYPNPFNPAFVVPFELYKSTAVDIKLYDISGRMVKIVADKEFSAGTYKLVVDGYDLSSGVYLLKIQVDNIVNTQKMLLVK